MQTLGLSTPGHDLDIIRAHKHCMRNRTEVQSSPTCGCFYCMSIFPPSEITVWIDEVKPPCVPTAP